MVVGWGRYAAAEAGLGPAVARRIFGFDFRLPAALAGPCAHTTLSTSPIPPPHLNFITNPPLQPIPTDDNLQAGTMLIPKADRKKIHEYLFRGMSHPPIHRRHLGVDQNFPD
jgi:hypothetical protein